MITIFGSNSLGIHDWMLSERILSHGSYTNIPVGSLLTEGQGSLALIAGIISGLFCQLCPWIRSLLQKPIVAQLVNELRAFFVYREDACGLQQPATSPVLN
jgi:hypothetical protein